PRTTTLLRHAPLRQRPSVAARGPLTRPPPAPAVQAPAAGSTAAAGTGAAAWLVMTATYVPMLRHYRQPLWLAPLLPFTAFLYLLMTVDSAVQHYRGRGAAWKGRTYARPDPVTDEN
ncbi:glycosyl transferase family 2, partial [Streptomyces sp. NPDC058964]